MPLFNIIENSGFLALAVLAVLLVFSVISWAIIFYKARQLRTAWHDTQRFSELFWDLRQFDIINENAHRNPHSLSARIFIDAYEEMNKGNNSMRPASIERVLYRSCARELGSIERMIPFLATVGSTSPFIGLFGTVVGIMNSFHSIAAKGSASLATVAPGIAESLVATAAGLLAAIPAVIAYNYFSSRIHSLNQELDYFASDFLSLLKDK